MITVNCAFLSLTRLEFNCTYETYLDLTVVEVLVLCWIVYWLDGVCLSYSLEQPSQATGWHHARKLPAEYFKFEPNGTESNLIHGLSSIGSEIELGGQGGRVVWVLDFESVGPGFESHSEHFMDLFLGSPEL